MPNASAIAMEIRRKLRGYDGLTPHKLIECPAILEALGTTDPQLAYELFKQELEHLPDNKYVSALKWALRIDPGLPEILTGSSGRRARFGSGHSVSEETVKLWEGRAIEALASALAAKSTDRLEKIAVLFYIEEKRIIYTCVTRFWTNAPLNLIRSTSSTNLRVVKQESANIKSMILPHALYKLQHDEHPSTLDVYTVFPSSQLPEKTFEISIPNAVGPITFDDQQPDLGGARIAVSLLDTDDLAALAQHAAVDETSGYMRRFVGLQRGAIYGIGWHYADPVG